MKPLVSLLFAVLLVLTVATSALAFPGKVTAVDDTVVTIQTEGPLPPWVKEGAMVQVLGGLGKITAVDGDKVSFRVRKGTAEKVKSGEALEVKPNRADGGKGLQGC